MDENVTNRAISERVSFIEKLIAEREQLAMSLRKNGYETKSDYLHFLAKQNEDVAAGMRATLNILFAE